MAISRVGWGKCDNGMHMCAEILAPRSSRAILVAMASVVHPVGQRHAKDITAMKTQLGRQHFNIEMSCGRMSAYLLEALSAWTNPDVLVDMGIASGSIHDQDPGGRNTQQTQRGMRPWGQMAQGPLPLHRRGVWTIYCSLCLYLCYLGRT